MHNLLLKIPLENGKAHIEFSPKKKFYADNFKHESDDFMLIMLGLNLSFTSLDIVSNFNFIIQKYARLGEAFLSELRGSFAGVLWDKKMDKWMVFNNQVGDQKLFYFKTDSQIVVSSDLFYLNNQLSDKSSLDIHAAYSLLSYGYMTDNATLVKGIFRLTAGEYFTCEHEQFSLKRYYEINNTPDYRLSEQDVIEHLDDLFRKAIQREFDKDLLYGYRHIAAMSGGLDCRMTNFVAHKMGYEDVSNITFSQYGYLDMTIAYNELKKDCETLFAEGSASEKMQVLTLLSAIKQLEL